MLIGQDLFATASFASVGNNSSEEKIEYWNQKCPSSTEWSQIKPTRVNLKRCRNANRNR